MPNKTTQILKEKIPSIETMLNCLRLEVDESIVQDVSKTIYEALSQQQQEDYQIMDEVLEKWIQEWAYLKDNPANRKAFPEDSWYPDKTKTGRDADPLRTVVTHVGLHELRKSIAEKRGKV
jgi:hypothetical protein